ncbi:hypothetical protein SUDANB121_05433 [Nocardiopsis dassonvillei]
MGTGAPVVARPGGGAVLLLDHPDGTRPACTATGTAASTPARGAANSLPAGRGPPRHAESVRSVVYPGVGMASGAPIPAQ